MNPKMSPAAIVDRIKVIGDAHMELEKDTAEMSKILVDFNTKNLEQDARLLDMEQKVIGSGNNRHQSSASIGVKPISAEAIDLLTNENHAFDHIAAGNAGTVKVKMGSSIRAALTHEPGSSGDTILPSEPEQGGITGPVTRRLSLLDIIPIRPVQSDSVAYVQLSATGEAEEQIIEGEQKAEVDFEGELRKADIATIAAHTTASTQALADGGSLEPEIDRVLRGLCKEKFEKKLINGGVSSNSSESKIVGLLESGTIFVPTIGTTVADKIGEALNRKADQGFTPSVVVMNNIDWFQLTLTRKSDDAESYVFGSPTMPIPPALWNTPVVLSSSLAQGTAMIIDFNFVSVLDRREATVMLSTSHKDYMTRNLVLILGEMRGGLEVRHTGAVWSIDIS